MTRPLCESQDRVHYKVDPIIGTYSLHTIGWIISGIFAITSSLISFWLVFRHATHYSVPDEQRHIIRILLLIPVYSLVSWASYVWYWYAVYWEVARDCYEAFVIASFFALLCQYVAPTLRSQKQFFRKWTPPPWPWPLNWFNACCCGIWRTPRSGLTWFNIIWIGIYQYCFIEVVTTIISMATQYTGYYCADSNMPYWAHVWMISVSCLCVTIAMYMLFAMYFALRVEFRQHKPGLKLLSIKLVVFFSFWQEILIDLLVSQKVINPSRTISYGDIYTGLNTFLICIEMTVFAIMHIFAFPWQEYTAANLSKKANRLTILEEVVVREKLPQAIAYGGFAAAIGDALNPWDAVKGFARGMKWLCCGRKQERKLREEKEKMELRHMQGGVEGASLPTHSKGINGEVSMPVSAMGSERDLNVYSGMPGSSHGSGVNDVGYSIAVNGMQVTQQR